MFAVVRTAAQPETSHEPHGIGRSSGIGVTALEPDMDPDFRL